MTDRELGIRAATTFPKLFPDAWKHSRHYSYDISDTSCLKCKCKPDKLDTPCTVPDPININWDNAHKLIRACKEELTIKCKLRDATPADYILAACQARESERE